MTYDERRVYSDGAGCQHGTEVYRHEPYRHYCMDCGADLDEIMDLAGLQADLDELEATDPIVKAAAASYANMVARITGAQRSEVDFYEDDEDPQAIRAAFDRGPHGVTGSGGARLICGNVEYVTVGGFVESHKDCRAALDAAQDEIEKLKGERDRARDLAVRSGAFTSDYGPPALTRTDFLADQFCWAVVGSRPSWMSPDQYDPCNCRLPKGHDPVDGPGTLGGHCCGAHDDDHPAAIARFGGAS